MSYALGEFDVWLGLSSFYRSFEDDEETIVDYEHIDKVFNDCCKELEARFILRRIDNPHVELAANERVIAFRIGADDFHFARKNSDGVWTHKPGSGTIREMSKYELFGDMWSDQRVYPYVSEVAFFAVIE